MTNNQVERISQEAVKAVLGEPKVTIIDLRSDKDWNASEEKIIGAVHESPGDVDSWMTKYPKDQKIFIY